MLDDVVRYVLDEVAMDGSIGKLLVSFAILFHLEEVGLQMVFDPSTTPTTSKVETRTRLRVWFLE